MTIYLKYGRKKRITIRNLSNAWVSFEIGTDVLYGLFLPDILPQQAVRMTLRLEIASQLFYPFPGREYCLKVSLATLLFLVVGQDLHIVLRQILKSFKERRNHNLVLRTTWF